MSIASAQAVAFYEQAARERRVYTILDDDNFLVFPIRDKEVVPFWSSRSRILRIQARTPKYKQWHINEIDLEEFMSKTLVQLEDEGIHVGVNWSGERLVGYDLSAPDLRANLDYWIKKVAGDG
jgi:hypothetical protein